MAIVVGATTSSSSSDFGTGNLTFTITVAAGTDCLVVTVGSAAALLLDRTILSVIFNGTEVLTLVPGSASDDGNFCASSIWRLLNPTATTADVVVTKTGAGNAVIGAGATRLTGVDQGTPTGTAATASGSSATASVAVTAASDDVTVGAIGSDSEGGITETGTLLWEVENIGSDISTGGQYYTTGNPTVQWSQSNTGWAVSGVALKAAGGAAATFWDKPIGRGLAGGIGY